MVKDFAAIINPPHSGILAVGAAERRPVVGADGELTTAADGATAPSADRRQQVHPRQVAAGAEALARLAVDDGVFRTTYPVPCRESASR